MFKYKVQTGDTLNKIANQYGFANYKLAGVTSVPSGNFDLIRPGEEIVLNNYNPNEIKKINNNPQFLSSNDASGEYKDLSSLVDKKLNANQAGQVNQEKSDNQIPVNQTNTDNFANTNTNTNPNNEKETAEKDPLYKEFLASVDKIKTNTEDWKKKKEIEINALLPKTLALLDAQYANSANNITNTYTKLLDEQQRINRVNVDRTKAYGLGAGGQYMPLEFTSAVSEQEQKAANEIAKLENERNNFLAQAKAARDAGEIATTRENMDALNKVEETMRQRVSDLSQEVQKRYELTVQVRKEQEQKHKEKLAKTLGMAQVKYLKDFQDAKSEDDKAKIIKKIILDSGGMFTNDDFYSIYSALSGAASGAKDAQSKKDKEEAEIAYKKAQTDKEKSEIKTAEERQSDIDKAKAQAAKDWADVKYKNAQIKNLENGKNDFSNEQKLKLEQVGIQDAPRQAQLDYLFGDEADKEDVVNKYGKESAMGAGGKNEIKTIDDAKKKYNLDY